MGGDMKIFLKIKNFIKDVFLGLLFLFVGIPIMAITGYQQMKQVEKDLVKSRATSK